MTKRAKWSITNVALSAAVIVMPACGGGGGGGPTNGGGPTSVSGDVVSGATGGGLGGMTVTITSGSDAGKSTVTAAGGGYTLDGLSDTNSVGVRVNGPGYESAEDVANGSFLDFTMLRNECQNSSCTSGPLGCNESLPMFRLPFNGVPPVSAVFDHTSPDFTEDGQFLSFCGGGGQYDGHSGWDFPMFVGTPILAAAKGQVVFAGAETPFFCPFLGRNVSGTSVVLSHRSPHGEEILTAYAHMSQLLVQEGESVGEGRKIGLSGNTGCSTGPHLHFEVVRRLPGPNNVGIDNAFPVDPFGWQGIGRDPWAVDPDGAVSAWMWKDAAGMGMSNSAISTRDMHNIPLRDLAGRPWRK